MQGYFVVLKTSYFAVTWENGTFRLPDLPPSNYTMTAWHESMGTLSQEIKISRGETKDQFCLPREVLTRVEVSSLSLG
jgi:hypothetical protein